jgi:hypothetical protein
LSITKIPPGVTQSRQLKITTAGAETVKSYTLTNQSFNWSVKPPTVGWQISGAAPRAIPIGVVEGPATGTRIAFCQVIEDRTKSLFDCRRLRLCLDAASCPTEFSRPDAGDLDLPPGKSTLYLALDPSYNTPGTYKGTVSLSARERSTAESLALELSYTSGCWKLLGALCMAAGVGVGWWMTTFVRVRMMRDRALFAVAALAKKLQELRDGLGTLPPAWVPKVGATQKAISDLLKQLTPGSLDAKGYLPTLWSGSGDTVAYQKFLNDTGEHVAMLQVIVESGMLVVAKRGAPAPPGSPDPIADALVALDELDTTIQPPSAATARTKVLDIIKSLDATRASRGLTALPAASVPVPTSEQLRLDIERLGWEAWLVWLVVTVIVGYLAVIDKSGFGSVYDLVICVLWGIGLPAAGTQLGQLTPATIATTLKVPVPQ